MKSAKKKTLEKAACENRVCIHKRSMLFFVDRDAISHHRPFRQAKTVPGTQKLHTIQGVEKGLIKTRRLSCFFNSCMGIENGECVNTNFVSDWTNVRM